MIIIIEAIALMAENIDLSIIRVYSSNNQVVGTAFMVNDRRILTCTHVVQDALGIDDKQKTDFPSDMIKVDFPLSKQKIPCSAQVIFWDIAKDIAVLKFIGSIPNEAAPAKLQLFENIQETKFRTFGFPNNYDAGVWATGVVRGKNADGWLQLEDVKAQGYKIEPGFSGAPVWDDDRQRVIGMIVAADTDGQIKAAYGIPADALITMLKMSSSLSLSENPYRGLEPFEAAHTQYFFGRTRMIQALAEKVSKQDFVAVVGPSGSGKSSLIRAGLLPRLKTETPYSDVVITPTKNPIDRLILSLLDWQNVYSLSDKLVEAKKISDLLQQDTATLQRFFIQILKDKGQTKLLLVIDQFEELFTLVADEKNRRLFIDTLIEISEAHFAKVVIAIRADFYGNLLADPNLGPLVNESQHNVLPLSKDELKEVIEQPAIMLGGRFQPGLVEIILQETMGQPGYLPLLEFALTQLWDDQTESGMLTIESYNEIGRVAGAMAKAAEQVVKKYQQTNKTDLIRQVFVRLVQPGLNAPDTRRRATKDEFSHQESEEIWDVVKDLADARLVVTNYDTATQDETVEVSHEALIQGWSRLGEWVEGDREFLTWRQSQLDPEIRKWEFSHRDSGSLLHGESLYIAKKWLRDRINDLSDEEKEFIFHSILFSNDDYKETFPLFKPFDKAIAFIEKYLNSSDERLQVNAIKAMEWINCSEEAGNEQLVFDKLRGLALGEYSQGIQKEAISVLSRIDKINLLAGELSKKQSEGTLKNLVFAFGYARNISLSGIKIDLLLAKKEFSKIRRKIQTESIAQLISAYRTDLAIPLLLAFALSQVVITIGQPLASLLTALVSSFSNFSDESIHTYIDFNILIDNFSLALTLIFYQFLFIRTKIIDNKSIRFKSKILIAVFAFLLSSLLAIVGAITRAVPQWLSGSHFLYALNNAFNVEAKYNDLIMVTLVLTNNSANLIALTVLSMVMHLEINMKRLLPLTFKWALLSTGLSALFIVILYLFDVGPHPTWLFSKPMWWFDTLLQTSLNGILLILPYWFVNIFIVWACLIGFYLGLKVSFLPRIMSDENVNSPIRIDFKRGVIYLLIVSILLYTMSQYKSILAIPCSILKSGSAVVTNTTGLYDDGDSRIKVLPIGTCVFVKGKGEYGSELYVSANTSWGWVTIFDLYWFNEGEEGDIPVVIKEVPENP